MISAYIRALFNGRPTTARMRTLRNAAPIGSCALGCGGMDKLEHYAVCPHIWAFLRAGRPQGLGLRDNLQSLQGFLLTEKGMSTTEKVAMAVGIYAASRTVAQARANDCVMSVAKLLRLHAMEGMR